MFYFAPLTQVLIEHDWWECYLTKALFHFAGHGFIRISTDLCG